MSSLLFEPMVLRSTKIEKQLHDQSVQANWNTIAFHSKKVGEFLKKPIGYSGQKTKKLCKKIKRGIATILIIYICTSSSGVILLFEAQQAHAIGLNIPAESTISQLRINHEKLTNGKNTFPQYLKSYNIRVDKVTMTKARRIADEMIIQLQNGSITSAQAISQIKGGDAFGNVIGLVIVTYLAYVISTGSFDPSPAIRAVVDHFEANAWIQPPNYHSNRKRQSGPTKPSGVENKPILSLLDLDNPTRPPGTELRLMQKPSVMPQQDYSALTKVQKSYLKDPRGRDMILVSEGLADLNVPYNRVWYKCKHAYQSGLPTKSNNKVEKTEENVLFVRDYIIDESCSSTTRRVENSEYWCKPESDTMQRGVSLYNNETKFLAFFTQIDGDYKLLTYVILTNIERDHFEATGNFVTEEVLKNPQWHQLESDLSSLSWSFPHMTNVSAQNQNNNENGFTPISGTFETDVEKITPTDAHLNNHNNNSPCGQDE